MKTVRSALSYLPWIALVLGLRGAHLLVDIPDLVRWWMNTIEVMIAVCLAVILFARMKGMSQELTEARIRLDVVGDVATSGLLFEVNDYLEEIAEERGTLTP